MDLASSLWQCVECVRQNSGQWLCFCVLTSPAEAVLVCSRDGDISTEAEERRHTRRRRAVSTRRLVPLAFSAQACVANGTHERSREFFDQVSD